MRQIPLIRRLAPAALLVVLAACASDGASAGGTIDDRSEWCDTIRAVEEQWKAVDSQRRPFEVKQGGYKRIGDLIADLEDGIAVVDRRTVTRC